LKTEYIVRRQLCAEQGLWRCYNAGNKLPYL
jgi:hypothetical protein